jgi:hypothetical protein
MKLLFSANLEMVTTFCQSMSTTSGWKYIAHYACMNSSNYSLRHTKLVSTSLHSVSVGPTDIV